MLKRTCVGLELLSGINAGRHRLAEQFGTMDGWQRKQDERFDKYVREKRQKQYFDAFDQRVERAFRAAAKAHKTEVTNAFKRKVKGGDGKWTAAVMLEVKTAVEERLRWLREVWTQIDADYRSGDVERQAKAAQEISLVLQGEPGAYMQWVYEQKREGRFLGPKEKAANEAELAGAELPDVSEDEANRYHNLALRMSDVEYNVKSRFGIAGQQHWAELQAAKDDAYDKKLDTAAEVYKQLLDQSARYDESRRTALLRSNVERVHQAQLRFKASMEMEKEREQLVEAHEAMQAERKAQARADRIAILQEAAEMRKDGATSEEVQQLARQRQLEAHARRQAEYQLREREELHQKKTHYLDMIDKFRTEVEMREGEEMLQAHRNDGEGGEGLQAMAQRSSTSTASLNVFGFMDADALPQEGVPEALASGTEASFAARMSPSQTTSLSADASSSAATDRSAGARKRELWESIDQDHYEDPFRTIHQARLDAVKTYDPVYEKFQPLALAQGRKYSKQGLGETAAGGDADRQVFKMAAKTALPYQWGLPSRTVHDLDGDGSIDYLSSMEWHVRDPKTRDIDWRYERKKGGAVFRGPRLYRMGEKWEEADPGSQSMDPSPATVRRFNPLAGGDKRQKLPAPPTGSAPAALPSWRST